MAIAKNIARVQQVLINAGFPYRLIQDWMFDTSKDFVADHGEEKEREIKDVLKVAIPEEADSPLLA